MTVKKKIVKKKAVKKAAKKKDPNKSAAAMNKKKNDAVKEELKEVSKAKPGTMFRNLLIDRKHTDEEIFEKVSKAFPGSPVKQGYCNNWRHWWNKRSGAKDLIENPLERLFRIDGKLVKKSDMPKKERKLIAKKYGKENDPLKNIAGINVSEQPVKKVAKKKSVKKPVQTDTLPKNKAIEKRKLKSASTS